MPTSRTGATSSCQTQGLLLEALHDGLNERDERDGNDGDQLLVIIAVGVHLVRQEQPINEVTAPQAEQQSPVAAGSHQHAQQGGDQHRHAH